MGSTQRELDPHTEASFHAYLHLYLEEDQNLWASACVTSSLAKKRATHATQPIQGALGLFAQGLDIGHGRPAKYSWSQVTEVKARGQLLFWPLLVCLLNPWLTAQILEASVSFL